MVSTILTSRGRRSSDTVWALLAVMIWVVAAALAVSYLYDRGEASAESTEPSVTATVTTATGFGETPAGGPIFTAYPETTTTTVATTTTVEVTTTIPRTTTTMVRVALTVAASGDVLGDRGVGLFMDKAGGEALFAHVRPFFETASIAFLNLEGPISDKGVRASWKEYTFRGRPALAAGLASAGIDVVSLANNHSNDYGGKALLDTFKRLDKVGVWYTGAGADAETASAPALLISPAGMVAVLAFTDIIPGGFAAGSNTPGVNITTSDGKRMASAIKKAAKQAKFVIASFHWGEEYKRTANSRQRQLAHQAIDAGADLVLGHHPHVLQGLEIYKDRLIAYSLGDFVWDHYSQETGETVILRVAIPGKGLPSIELVPVYLDDITGVPAPVTGEHAASILNRVARYSADLGLQLNVRGDRAYFNAGPASPE